MEVIIEQYDSIKSLPGNEDQAGQNNRFEQQKSYHETFNSIAIVLMPEMTIQTWHLRGFTSFYFWENPKGPNNKLSKSVFYPQIFFKIYIC